MSCIQRIEGGYNRVILMFERNPGGDLFWSSVKKYLKDRPVLKKDLYFDRKPIEQNVWLKTLIMQT